MLNGIEFSWDSQIYIYFYIIGSLVSCDYSYVFWYLIGAWEFERSPTPCDKIPYSGFILREKIFANAWHLCISRIKFSRIAIILATPPKER